MNKILAIFDNSLSFLGFVSVFDGVFEKDLLNKDKKLAIENILSGIMKKDDGALRLFGEFHREEDIVTYFKMVLPGDQKYIYALGSRFNEAGYRSAVIDDRLKETFLQLHQSNISPEEKKGFFRDLVNIKDDQVETFFVLKERLTPLFNQLKNIEDKFKKRSKDILGKIK